MHTLPTPLKKLLLYLSQKKTGGENVENVVHGYVTPSSSVFGHRNAAPSWYFENKMNAMDLIERDYVQDDDALVISSY